MGHIHSKTPLYPTPQCTSYSTFCSRFPMLGPVPNRQIFKCLPKIGPNTDPPCFHIFDVHTIEEDKEFTTPPARLLSRARFCWFHCKRVKAVTRGLSPIGSRMQQVHIELGVLVVDSRTRTPRVSRLCHNGRNSSHTPPARHAWVALQRDPALSTLNVSDSVLNSACCCRRVGRLARGGKTMAQTHSLVLLSLSIASPSSQ